METYITQQECGQCGSWLDLYVDATAPRKAWKECTCGNVPFALHSETGVETVMPEFTALRDCPGCNRMAGEPHRPRCADRGELAKKLRSQLRDQQEAAMGPEDFKAGRDFQKPNISPWPENQEEKPMQSDQNEKPNNPTVDMLGSAVSHAGKVAVAAEAGDVLLEIAEAALGERYPDLFKTDEGKQIAKMTVAIMLHYGSASYPGAFPAPEAVGKACQYVVEGAARDLIQPRLTALRPKLDKLATVGEKIHKLEAKPQEGEKPNGASTHVPAGQVPSE